MQSSKILTVGSNYEAAVHKEDLTHMQTGFRIFKFIYSGIKEACRKKLDEIAFFEYPDEFIIRKNGSNAYCMRCSRQDLDGREERERARKVITFFLLAAHVLSGVHEELICEYMHGRPSFYE